jgi:S-formylglutathione hydrolase FrmB
MRDALNEGMEIPDDPELEADLAGPQYGFISKQQIQVEKKEDMKKRGLVDYKIRDNKFHIAGPSNGGIASFHVASLNPDYFLSITEFPGYLWEETPAHIQATASPLGPIPRRTFGTFLLEIFLSGQAEID